MGEKRKSIADYFVKKTTLRLDEEEDVGIYIPPSKSINNNLIVESEIIPVVELEDVSITNFPEIWSKEKWDSYKIKFSWLICKNGQLGCDICTKATVIGNSKLHNISVSKEWTTCSIGFYGNTRSKQMKSLRKKIVEHENSKTHLNLKDVIINKEKLTLVQIFQKGNNMHVEYTSKIFRTAYYIAKNDKPYSDYFNLLQLQEINGANIPIGLRSRYSSTQIIDSIAKQMRKKLCAHIQKINSKFSILIDESTSLSQKSTLILYLKCELNKIEEPNFIFLDLIDLNELNATAICNATLDCLKHYGFDHEFCEKNLIAFASDGASVMLGKNNGVASKLTTLYPNIIVWHCLNHRLELSIGDVINEVHGVNHFKAFLDKLYSLYSRSPLNQRELSACAKEVEIQIKKIGRVLGTRWVASSYKTVSAVWQNYSSLCNHFEHASYSPKRDSKEKSTFSGLFKKIASTQFVQDLALMCDVLEELAILSESLQNRNVTLVYADKLIRRTIQVFYTMKDTPGLRCKEIDEAVLQMKFKNIVLKDNPKIVMINRLQFLTSIINMMNKRLFNNTTLLDELKVLDYNYVPSGANIDYGNSEIKSLCTRFGVPYIKTINAYRDFLESKGQSIKSDLKALNNICNVIPCSTSECERGFSHMNLIVTEKRTRLLTTHVSSLIFLKLQGPPLSLWKPEEYVNNWLIHHRSAIDERTRVAKEIEAEPNPVWKYL